MKGNSATTKRLSSAAIILGTTAISATFLIPAFAIFGNFRILELLYIIPPLALVGVVLGIFSVKGGGKIGIALNILATIFAVSLILAIRHPTL